MTDHLTPLFGFLTLFAALCLYFAIAGGLLELYLRRSRKRMATWK